MYIWIVLWMPGLKFSHNLILLGTCFFNRNHVIDAVQDAVQDAVEMQIHIVSFAKGASLFLRYILHSLHCILFGF